MSARPRQGAIGRADLLRVLRDAAPEDRADIAKLIGFQEQYEVDSEVGHGAVGRGIDTVAEAGIDRPTAIQPLRGESHEPRAPVLYWFAQVTGELATEPPAEVPGSKRAGPIEVLTVADIGRVPGARVPPPPPSLAPWSRLRRVMEEVCRPQESIGAIDVDAVVAKLGRGDPLGRIPRRMRRKSAARLMVIVDRSLRLAPFWRDQYEVSSRIEAEIMSGVHCEWWPEGPPVGGTDGDRLAFIAHGLGPGDVVLVLGDLGHYGSDALQRAWAALGAAIGRRGADAVALLPVPAARWRNTAVRSWRALDWTASTRRPSRGRHADDERVERRDDLLALVSWAVRIEPALLRDVRVLLPVSDADAGTEADVWNHEAARRHSSGLLLPRELRMSAQRRLLEMMKQERWKPLVRQVVGAVRRRHAARSRELWLEEARNLEWIDPQGGWIEGEERERVMTFSRKISGAFAPGGADSLGPSIDLGGWADRTLERVPEKVWADEVWRGALMPAFMARRAGTQRIELLPGMDVGMLPATQEDGPVRSFAIRQVGAALQVDVEERVAGAVGSPVAIVRARERLSMEVRGAARSMAYGLGGELPVVIPMPEGESCSVTTDCGVKVELRLESKPAWAEAMGRDREGLWVEYRGWRLEWPVWAREVGEDEFGLWASVRVGEVEQRFRWIAPGTFVMGSPEGEEGRFEREGPQHDVTLTEGYWLADTPCTQAMWQAVMGDNPSEYQSPRRPVEQVSWDDVQGFLAKLNEAAPGLEAGLPSEAQWEYACRADTTTATYAGDQRILGENNAPLLDDIAWYGGNSGVGYELEKGWDSSGWPNKQHPHSRAGTRDVATKQPNSWGLYDMLGNVLEWCADMPRDYTTATRGPKRVSRGGSWGSSAQFVRAAFRGWLAPGDRYDYLGFRLVRGQGLRKQAKPATRQQGRGTSPASPGGRGKKGV